jgi:predicted peroxiredoxin
MANYLLLESRDPFDSAMLAHQYDLAARLVREGNSVTLFLMQNGVLSARRGVDSGLPTRASEAGVEVLADAFSLRERGIASDQLASGVRIAPLRVIIAQLAAGHKALWH